MSKTYLKNGFIADGTGEAGYLGNVLVENDRIVCVSREEIPCEDAQVIDCREEEM